MMIRAFLDARDGAVAAPGSPPASCSSRFCTRTNRLGNLSASRQTLLSTPRADDPTRCASWPLGDVAGYLRTDTVGLFERDIKEICPHRPLPAARHMEART